MDQIVAAAGQGSYFEVGPGPGVLTAPLALLGPLVAVEADPRMAEVAAEAAPSARVVLADALQVDWRTLLAGLPEPRVVVSNMPYNITGPLLARVSDSRDLLSHAVLMMQKEVGDKVLARPGDSARGALSVLMQRWFEVTRVCLAPPGAFAPPPKVESVVLRFVPRGAARPDEDNLAAFVRRGFSQPRKKLATNLGPDRDAVELCGLDPNIRPHQVGQDDWERLFDARPRTPEG